MGLRYLDWHLIVIDMKRQNDDFSVHLTNSSRFSQVNTDEKTCDWPDCMGTGEHRAPMSRKRVKDFYWFCLDHVRIYNRSWNYYEGMSDDQVEALVRSDTTWNRPTWPLGSLHGSPVGRAGDHPMGPEGFGRRFEDIGDPLGILGDDYEHGNRPNRNLPETERQALALLDLSFPLTVDDVKVRYKELVKRFHPDATGGDKNAEERFKQINEAYRTIIEFLAP